MKYMLTLPIFLLTINASAQTNIEEFSGVVTLHLIPAKVMKINEIVENPEPGTSYIGKQGILVEVEENPTVLANWTVVDIRYFRYPEPKTIEYEILSEKHELSVNYHAVNIEITGDLSSYMKD
jgi:hypothetical protein